MCVYSTLEQARKLDKMLSARGSGIDAVLDFEVPDSLLVSGWQRQKTRAEMGERYWESKVLDSF